APNGQRPFRRRQQHGRELNLSFGQGSRAGLRLCPFLCFSNIQVIGRGDSLDMKCANRSCTRLARPGLKKCEGCAATARRYYEKTKTRYPLNHRRHYLKKRFGITPEEYSHQFDEQYGLCACCGQPETIKRRGKVILLAVDHNHATGSKRGLLCGRCNRVLG